MDVNVYIASLVQYGLDKKLIEPCDTIYVTNQLLDAMKLNGYEPAEPIAEKNKAAFESVRDRIIAELNGQASPEMIITELAQLEIRSDSTAAAEPSVADKK